MRETPVLSLGWEDPLEERMATHCSILARKIPWTEEPSRIQPTGSQRVGRDQSTEQSRSEWDHFKTRLLLPVIWINSVSTEKIKNKKNKTRLLFFLMLLNNFIFFPFIFISWRLITLQYCTGFCHTLTWISHGFTCIPHPDPPSHKQEL